MSAGAGAALPGKAALRPTQMVDGKQLPANFWRDIAPPDEVSGCPLCRETIAAGGIPRAAHFKAMHPDEYRLFYPRPRGRWQKRRRHAALFISQVRGIRNPPPVCARGAPAHPPAPRSSCCTPGG